MRKFITLDETVPRVFPRADFFISLGRFGVGCPALILLLFSIANFHSTAEFLAVTFFTCVITFLGRKIGLIFRDSMELSDFCEIIEKQGAIKSYGLRDYFPYGLIANIVRDHRIISPDYKLLYSPGYETYAVVQYDPKKSFIVVPFEPYGSNPIRLFYLLHALGCIGKKAYLTRAPSPAVVWHVAFAFIPLLLFASPSSWCVYALWFFLTNAVVRLSIDSIRIESEIEADHTALLQVFFSQRLRNLSIQFLKQGIGILTDQQILPPDDRKMLDSDKRVRNDVFEKMRVDAQNSELTFADFYIWLAVRSRECKVLIAALAILLATAYLEPVDCIGIGWVSLTKVLLFISWALAFASVLKQSNLNMVNNLIQAKAHDVARAESVKV